MRSTTEDGNRRRVFSSRSMILAPAAIAAVMLLLSACATAPQGRHVAGGVPYVGRASGSTPLEALSAAKLSAVYHAAADILGEQTASTHRAEIEAAIRDSDNPNAYVYNQTLEILKTGGNPLSYEVRIEVNVRALTETLHMLGLTASAEGRASGAPAPSASAATSPAVSGGSVASSQTAGASTESLSAEVRARIERDLNQMTYMVTFAEGSSLDPFIMRAATTSADAYLADNRIPYVESSQVEALRKDQERVYEEETNKSVSMTQWIAQRLHADIYIVIDGHVSSTSRDGRYLATAEVSLRIFETSTASGLGAANYTSIQPSVSLVARRDAIMNAMQSSVYKAMGAAVTQTRSYIARDLSSGIVYDLLVINTPDDRAMNAFMKNLGLRVRDVRLVSWSPQETRYRVTVRGTASDVQDFVYETAQAVPGFSGMALVTLRGRELTFDTGM